jgi:hypothetical protein
MYGTFYELGSLRYDDDRVDQTKLREGYLSMMVITTGTP